MAAAIKKELLEDEERLQKHQHQRRKRSSDGTANNHRHRKDSETYSSHEDDRENGQNGMDHSQCDSLNRKSTNGHENGQMNHSSRDLEENEENIRQHDLRAHLFLATVSHQHQQQNTEDHPESLSSATESANPGFQVPCPLCQAPLEQRVFRQHLDHHYPRDSPVCPVIQCGRRFAHPNSVRNHMRLKHAVQWLKMKAMRSSGGPFVGLPGDHSSTISLSPFTKKEFL